MSSEGRARPTEAVVEETQINLFCRDVVACAAFYEAFGLPRAFVWPPEGEPVKIELDAAGVRIGFDAIDEANRIADLGVEPAGVRSAEVALWVRDVDAAHERALRAGGSTLREPMDGPDGRLRYAWVLDPEGHQVKLLAKRAR